MDFIITFFRDILDGYLYTFVAIICFILICSCIGYLAEVSINKKKQKQEYDNSHATVISPQQNTLSTETVETLEQAVPIAVETNSNSSPVPLQSTSTSASLNTMPINSGTLPGAMNMNIPSQGSPPAYTVGLNQTQQIPPIPMGGVNPSPSVVNTAENVNYQQNE